MAVHIRLRRIGKNPKKRPYFRISVFDERVNRDGRIIEEIGIYDPTKDPVVATIKRDRFDYWVKNGAQPSATVKSLVKKGAK